MNATPEPEVGAGVAIYHRLHIDGGAPLGGNIVFAAIDNRAVVHPGTEHGANGAPSCFHGSLGKFLAGALLDQRLEPRDQFLQVGHGQLGVLDVRLILFVLVAVDDRFKRFVVLPSRFCTPMTMSPYIWMKRR